MLAQAWVASDLGAVCDMELIPGASRLSTRSPVLRCDAERGQPGPGQQAGSGNSAPESEEREEVEPGAWTRRGTVLQFSLRSSNLVVRT